MFLITKMKISLKSLNFWTRLSLSGGRMETGDTRSRTMRRLRKMSASKNLHSSNSSSSSSIHWSSIMIRTRRSRFRRRSRCRRNNQCFSVCISCTTCSTSTFNRSSRRCSSPGSSSLCWTLLFGKDIFL